MAKLEHFDLCIIGGGSAGLVMASVAGQLGFKVALFEGGHMGGDCLNYGCVPSKALLAAAHAANGPKNWKKFGLSARADVNFSAVMTHVHEVIAAIAPHDSAERFRSLGVDVIRAYAAFTGPDTITGGNRTIKARRFVIAAGSRPFIPPIDGLDKVNYLTNESIFNLTEQPDHLIILGGGPIGVEMAQAFARLGTKVSLIQHNKRLLPRDDADAAALITQQLQADGVAIHTATSATKVTKRGAVITVHGQANGNELKIKGSHLLIATGRSPNVEEMGLDKAKVTVNTKGIETNCHLQTSNRRIYAAGDVTGPYQFTHMGAYQAGVVIQRVLFGNKLAKVNYAAVPWVTYTQPEIAQAGLNQQQAQERYGNALKTINLPIKNLDRATAERDTTGFIKVMVGPKGKVVGATIVGTQAGELITTWVDMMSHKRPLKALANVIHPYPTRHELNRKVVSEYYKTKLFAPRTRWLAKLLFKLLG